MMLRASSQATDRDFDYQSIVDGNRTSSSGVPHGDLLVEFSEAVYYRDELRIDSARKRIRSEMGDRALVDVSGVVANFHRMTRIADGTGIPLDQYVLDKSDDLREGLGINDYASARNTFA